MKSPSPLLGFNTNVRHKGRVFHVQTEDSGIKHPHIITHLFADGGRILKTTKTSYAEHVGSEKMAETVRAMMQEQHKAMFLALRDGQYDHLIDAPAAPPKTGVNQVPAMPPPTGANRVPAIPPPSPSSLEAAPMPPAAAAPEPPAPAFAPPAPPPPPPPAAPPAPAFKPSPPPGYAPAAVPAATPQRSPSRPALQNPDALIGQRAAAAPPAPPAPPTSSSAPPQQRSSPSRPALNALRSEGAPPDAGYQARMQPERPVDLEALERAAQEVQSPFLQQMDLPPPPAAVLAKKPSGSHSSASFRAVSPESTPRMPSEPPAHQSPGRYTQPRPAAAFGATRPAEGVSIFGEDLISEKSLDEVILSYLAEDLDTPSEKK